MNTLAKLFIGREERELNFVKLDCHRYTRVTGRSQTEVLGGLIQVRFTPKGDEDTILRWMFTHRMEDKNTDPSKSYYTLKDGEEVFYEGDSNIFVKEENLLNFMVRIEKIMSLLYDIESIFNIENQNYLRKKIKNRILSFEL